MNILCPQCKAELEGDASPGDVIECPCCGLEFKLPAKKFMVSSPKPDDSKNKKNGAIGCLVLIVLLAIGWIWSEINPPPPKWEINDNPALNATDCWTEDKHRDLKFRLLRNTDGLTLEIVGNGKQPLLSGSWDLYAGEKKYTMHFVADTTFGGFFATCKIHRADEETFLRAISDEKDAIVLDVHYASGKTTWARFETRGVPNEIFRRRHR